MIVLILFKKIKLLYMKLSDFKQRIGLHRIVAKILWEKPLVPYGVVYCALCTQYRSIEKQLYKRISCGYQRL